MKLTKEEKAALKKEKIVNRRIKKENKKIEFAAMHNQVIGQSPFEGMSRDEIFDYIKKEKELKKQQRKYSFKTLPIAIVKEAHKLKYPTKKSLGLKFVSVLLILIFVALLFFAIDTSLFYLFKAAKIL